MPNHVDIPGYLNGRMIDNFSVFSDPVADSQVQSSPRQPQFVVALPNGETVLLVDRESADALALYLVTLKSK